MKISIKLKHTQIISLVNTLECIIDTEECRNRNDAIVVILMVKFYAMLKKKSVLMETGTYTISVGPETAMAFIEFFLVLPVDTSSQLGNIIDKMMFEFDQKTTQYFSPHKTKKHAIHPHSASFSLPGL